MYTLHLVFICLCIRIALYTNVMVIRPNRSLLYRPPSGRNTLRRNVTCTTKCGWQILKLMKITITRLASHAKTLANNYFHQTYWLMLYTLSYMHCYYYKNAHFQKDFENAQNIAQLCTCRGMVKLKKNVLSVILPMQKMLRMIYRWTLFKSKKQDFQMAFLRTY